MFKKFLCYIVKYRQQYSMQEVMLFYINRWWTFFNRILNTSLVTSVQQTASQAIQTDDDDEVTMTIASAADRDVMSQSSSTVDTQPTPASGQYKLKLRSFTLHLFR